MSVARKSALLLGAAIALSICAPAMALQNTASAAASSTSAKPPANAPYRNASLPIEQRVADLLSRMTLDEKVAQLLAIWDSKADIQDPKTTAFDAAKARSKFPNGIGQYSRPSDRLGPSSPRVVKRRNARESVD